MTIIKPVLEQIRGCLPAVKQRLAIANGTYNLSLYGRTTGVLQSELSNKPTMKQTIGGLENRKQLKFGLFEDQFLNGKNPRWSLKYSGDPKTGHVQILNG